MEDIKAYIESGILELYVLGDLSQDEKIQVEEMASMHPTVKAEIAEIERALEAYATENAIAPPQHLREKILNSLITNLAVDNLPPSGGYIDSAPAEATDNVVAFPTSKTNSFYKYAFAASLAALIMSLFGLYSLNNKLQESQGQVALLQNKNQSFANKVNLLDNEINVFHDPTIKLIKLQGTPKTPSSQMVVAWSPQKKKVMIDMQDMKLAENDKAHQYQLWAIVAGKPVDLGVFDSKADTTGMVEMKSVANAVAFAVTVEPRGGSVNPTMDQMVVIAKI